MTTHVRLLIVEECNLLLDTKILNELMIYLLRSCIVVFFDCWFFEVPVTANFLVDQFPV